MVAESGRSEGEEHRTPGQLIEALLLERGWTQRMLAVVLDVGVSTLNKVIAGKQQLTAELALALSEIFGVEAERFLALQKDYELALARLVAKPNPQRSARAHLIASLPVREMASRGWIDLADSSDLAAVEAQLVRFFGVKSVDEIEILPHAAKRTAFLSPPSPEQVAWLYRVRQIADSTLVTGVFSDVGVRVALKKLDGLLASAHEVRQVPAILSDCGIRFVIVEGLKGSRIDGVCFWLDDRSPVIGMTLRYDRLDNFWFVLRHELEHVIRRHGREAVAIDVDLEGRRAGVGPEVPEQERIANAAAAAFCVPQDKLQMFMVRKDPYFSDRDVRAFARMLDVHPGLIVGQIQWRTERYNLLRKHLAQIRSHVTPDAFVDGWGDVFPVTN